MNAGAALIEWPGPIIELVEFVGAFMAAGAVGFRYTTLRRLPDAGGAGSSRAVAARRAAVMPNLPHEEPSAPAAASASTPPAPPQ